MEEIVGTCFRAIFLGIGLFWGIPMNANAGCENDMDCKGDRVCEDGECTEPVAASTPAAPAAGVSEAKAIELDSAQANAIVGYVGAGGGLLFGVAAMALNGEGAPAYMSGAGSLLTIGITAPVAAGGGAKARRLARASGVPVPSSALPATAWVAYTLTIIEGGTLITLGVMDEDVSTGLIASTVATGVAATLAMGIDANTASSSVRESLNRNVAHSTPRRRHPVHMSLLPIKGGGTLAIGGTL